MKKRLALLFITSFFIANSAKAEFGFDTPADYTGEAFFTAPHAERSGFTFGTEEQESKNKGTIPPIKQLRIKLQNMQAQKDARNYELAPTAADIYSGEVETSEFASKDVEENFDEISEEETETSDEIAEGSNSKKKSLWRKKKKDTAVEDSEDMVLDCERIEYDTENLLVYATGNVSVEFVKQGTVVKSDIITFDRANNTIKAEGNVRIIKNGQIITGEYIFVDLNEENALIEKPMTKTATMDVRSEKGYVYGNKIVQENGSMIISDSFPIEFRSGKRGPRIRTMLVPEDETLTEDISKGIVTFKAEEIKLTQKGDLEIISLKKPQVFKGDKRIFRTKSVKIYTNKNHDYGETDHWEVGFYRGLGLYIGPGVVFELPKGSVLKAMPILNYKSGIGVGGYTRFSSGTNKTLAAYGSAESKFIILGQQKLDDNLNLQYGMNAYMDEWFLGRRRPKYGLALAYDKTYSSSNFLLKDRTSTFSHRFQAGYYQDLDFDKRFEKLNGTNMGTTRFRYMAQAMQNFYEYKDPEKLKAFSLGLSSQLSAALYGTGDTQVIGRLGPNMHIQYKRWMQDVGLLISAYDDNTPMPVFDAYRYGKQALYFREYFRLTRWLTVAWFANYILSNDAPNGKDLQENAFYFSFGPDDIKFNLGYDFVRETMRCTVDIMMDAKGTNVQYDKLEITQDKKRKSEKKEGPVNNCATSHRAPTQPKILEKAVVEDIRIHEDVL